MLAIVGSTLTQVISWVGEVITALVDTTANSPGALSALLPLFAISISIAVLFCAFRVIRSLIWGA